MRLVTLLLFIAITFFSCLEPDRVERVVNLKLYLNEPISSSDQSVAPAELIALLKPISCQEGVNIDSEIRLEVFRLDTEPLESEVLEVPLTSLNSTRKKGQLLSFKHLQQNFESESGNTPNIDILWKKGNAVPRGNYEFNSGIIYQCCQDNSGENDNVRSVSSLDDFAKELIELSCVSAEEGEDVPENLDVTLIYTRAEVEPITLNSNADSSASLKDKILESLNTIGSQDLPISERQKLIPEALQLFSDTAFVKIYGLNGTMVDMIPVSEYLETISYYKTLVRVYVDEAFENDGLCWEIRIRETYE